MVMRLGWKFWRKSYGAQIRRQMAALGVDLPPLLLKLIDWLEANGYAARSTQREALLIAPRPNLHSDRYSDIRFEFPQKDFMKSWLGKTGYERRVIPFIACAGDGSYIGLWPMDEETGERFVFLGSEGECFTVANNVHDLIALITMGYDEIHGREELSLSPAETWLLGGIEEPWPGTGSLADLMQWARRDASIIYPTKGSVVLPFAPEDDPFTAYVGSILDD